MPVSRAFWKGYLKLSFVSCPVALYPATSAAERISFRQVNRRTGHRLRHKLIDSVTGEPVDPANKARGYEVAEDQFVLIEDRDLERARSARPPSGTVELVEPLRRESLSTALAVRHEPDLIEAATEDDEEEDDNAPIPRPPPEMMKLAQHIIRTKAAEFDPSMLEDHYRRALVGILRKKQTKRSAHAAAINRQRRTSSI